jgi:hypothetical protein
MTNNDNNYGSNANHRIYYKNTSKESSPTNFKEYQGYNYN